jgi:mono/diheme cytochrome c family protein
MSRSTFIAALVAAIPLALFPFLVSANAAKPSSNTVPKNRGEQVFEQNCSRCHMPPMSLPPRVTGTILAHMRTRARLSREDEKALLAFMAPK